MSISSYEITVLLMPWYILSGKRSQFTVSMSFSYVKSTILLCATHCTHDWQSAGPHWPYPPRIADTPSLIRG